MTSSLSKRNVGPDEQTAREFFLSLLISVIMRGYLLYVAVKSYAYKNDQFNVIVRSYTVFSGPVCN